MASNFINPIVGSASRLWLTPFDETDPIVLRQAFSQAEVEIVIRAVYRQVLGNAYVMESERLVVPESQLRQREVSIREFVRQVAKSGLYRSRFFDNCYRYRAIELNFKHLLGRAPDNFEEMKYHSAVLDQNGFEAEIDSYLDSDEYQNTFGENTVPYYRGHKTRPGQSMLEFTNMLELVRSASSSDKDLMLGNKPKVQRSLIVQRPYGKAKTTDVNQLIAEALKPKIQFTETPLVSTVAEQELQRQIKEQKEQITSLHQKLADLRPFATLGASISGGWQNTTSTSDTRDSGTYTSLQQQVEAQAAQIKTLEEQVADAYRYALIGEARANKWQRRR
jgi:phycoerythrin-associated linker protein